MKNLDKINSLAKDVAIISGKEMKCVFFEDIRRLYIPVSEFFSKNWPEFSNFVTVSGVGVFKIESFTVQSGVLEFALGQQSDRIFEIFGS